MKTDKNTPSIRFAGFTDAWERRKLGDLGHVSMCKRIFKEQTAEEGEVPFYKIGTFGGQPDAFISRSLFEEFKTKYPYPQKGDILISASGSIGRTVEFSGNDEYFQDSNIVWFHHDDRIQNCFLKHFYLVVEWAGLEGSTIKRLYNETILGTLIIYPSPCEQQLVGDFFSALDRLITLHQRKLEKLQNIKKACLEKMFPKNGELVPAVRFAGFTDAWERRTLRETSSNIYGGGTPSTGNEAFWGGTIPWVQSSDLTEYQLNCVHPRKYITEQAIRKSAAKLVPPHSLAIVTRVGVGKLAVMSFSYATSQDFLSLSNLNIDLLFGAYSLYKKIQSELYQVQGTSIKGITKDELLDKIISIPSGLEQQKIGTFFRQLDRLITLHQHKLEKLQNIKKACLEKMFV